jgi:hypothetical protein
VTAPSRNLHRTGSQAHGGRPHGGCPHGGRPHGGRPQGPRWSRDQIRAARVVFLVPLLEKRGLQLIARDAGNFELPAHPGLMIKDSYWRWPERNLAGNTIDFYVQVLGLTFHNAMREITAA